MEKSLGVVIIVNVVKEILVDIVEYDIIGIKINYIL